MPTSHIVEVRPEGSSRYRVRLADSTAVIPALGRTHGQAGNPAAVDRV